MTKLTKCEGCLCTEANPNDDSENLKSRNTKKYKKRTIVLKGQSQKKNTISEGRIESDSFSLHVNKGSNIYQKLPKLN